MIKLGTNPRYKVTAIATQGGAHQNLWVKQYTLRFRVGDVEVPYKESETPKVRNVQRLSVIHFTTPSFCQSLFFARPRENELPSWHDLIVGMPIVSLAGENWIFVYHSGYIMITTNANTSCPQVSLIVACWEECNFVQNCKGFCNFPQISKSLLLGIN